MSKVTSKIERFTAADPYDRDDDPWRDFREIEIIGLEWTQKYRHSLGKYSRFFLGLEEGRFLATRCPVCGRTYAPPRPACPDCLRPTRWIELSGRGEIVSWSVLHYAPKMMTDRLKTPYVLVYVKLDGADTLFAHLLDNEDGVQVEHGQPVEIVYREGPVDHPIMLMAFKPIKGREAKDQRR